MSQQTEMLIRGALSVLEHARRQVAVSGWHNGTYHPQSNAEQDALAILFEKEGRLREELYALRNLPT